MMSSWCLQEDTIKNTECAKGLVASDPNYLFAPEIRIGMPT